MALFGTRNRSGPRPWRKGAYIGWLERTYEPKREAKLIALFVPPPERGLAHEGPWGTREVRELGDLWGKACKMEELREKENLPALRILSKCCLHVCLNIPRIGRSIKKGRE